MTVTSSNALYAPEVWEDLAQAKFKGAVVVANNSQSSDILVGQPGNAAEFPEWDALGELSDLTEGTPMVPEAMGQSSTKATIKSAGKAVEILDKAKLTGSGNAQDEAIRQFGVLAARKVDGDLITVAGVTVTDGITKPDGSIVGDSAPLSNILTAGNTVLTYDAIVDSITAFGDDFDPEDAVFYVRTDQMGDLYKDDQFIAASQMNTGNDIVLRGYLGKVAGMDVFKTNRLAARRSLIVKRDALGVIWKQRPIVEQDRDILKSSTVVATTLHYAVKRLDDKGVCVIETASV